MWSRAFPTSTRRPCRRRVVTSAGDVYNADQVERSSRTSRRKWSSRLRLRAGPARRHRDPASRTIQLGYVVEEGPRVERINVRGNSRTRDYVIRREPTPARATPTTRYSSTGPSAASTISATSSGPHHQRAGLRARPRRGERGRVEINCGFLRRVRRLLDGRWLHRRGLGLRVELPRPRPFVHC